MRDPLHDHRDDGNEADAARGLWWLPACFRGYQVAWLSTDIVAGITLAAVSIPECMGYTKISGTPVVTGLYTLLLPMAIFAVFSSSRHLVVAADSATAAILYAGLVGVARPYSGEWLRQAEMAALLTAGFLFIAAVFRLGFVADFLSRTLLVGFLSGVGVSLVVGQIPDLLGISPAGSGVVMRLVGVVRALPSTHIPTFEMGLAVLAVMVISERVSTKAPGALLAVAMAVAATWIVRLDHHGIAIVGSLEAGLPRFSNPWSGPADALRLLPMAASMFLVIVAQSAATARSFAQKYGEPLKEDHDLVALGAANVAAGLSGTFVVNGSPTKTAIVDAAGGRTQVSQLATSAVTLLVVLFATRLIAWMPQVALAALVFLIGVRLVDMRALRQIYRFRKGTFGVAMATLLAVVLLGIERGIFVAIVLSVIDHLAHQYHPKDVVLAPWNGGWKGVSAEKNIETEPGLLVYRFSAPLFFANADYFSARVHKLVDTAPNPVQCMVFDMVSMADIDYTAALTLLDTIERLEGRQIALAITQAEDVRDVLDYFGITERVGESRLFESIQAAVDAFRHGDLKPEGRV